MRMVVGRSVVLASIRPRACGCPAIAKLRPDVLGLWHGTDLAEEWHVVVPESADASVAGLFLREILLVRVLDPFGRAP